MIFLIFLNINMEGSSMRYILHEKLEHGPERDPLRTDPFDEELEIEFHNMDYIPTYEDVIDLFTIAKVSPKKMISAFGGGIQKMFTAVFTGGTY